MKRGENRNEMSALFVYITGVSYIDTPWSIYMIAWAVLRCLSSFLGNARSLLGGISNENFPRLFTYAYIYNNQSPD